MKIENEAQARILEQCSLLEDLADSMVGTNKDLPDLPVGAQRRIVGYRRLMPDGKLYDMVVIWKHADMSDNRTEGVGEFEEFI